MTALRVLLIEDEALIAMMAEDMIVDLGHAVAGICPNLTAALDACGTVAFDAALVDVNLGGDNSMPVADALKALGRPFAFTTGYGAGGVATVHGDVPVLTKPYAVAELEAVLAGFAQRAGVSSITSNVDSNRG